MAPPADRLRPAAGPGPAGGAPGATTWHRRRAGLVAQSRRYLPLAGLPAGQRRARVLTASAALAVATGLAVAPLSSGDALLPLQVTAGFVGVVLVLASLIGWSSGIGWSVALLAADYAAVLTGRPNIDPAAPLEAAGLILVAELAAWSLECRTVAPDRPGVLTWRLRRLALVEALAVVSGTAVLAAADLPAHGGTALGAIGVASAVTVLAVAATLLHRLKGPAAGRVA